MDSALKIIPVIQHLRNLTERKSIEVTNRSYRQVLVYESVSTGHNSC